MTGNKKKKHELWELKQMQTLPLELKIKKTQQRIREWYDCFDGNVYVSFSGGKDSTVLKHIIDNMYTDVPSVFVNTGLEYPEIQSFVREVKTGKYDCFNSDLEILYPEMRFDEVISTYGYPVISKEVARGIQEATNWAKKSADNKSKLIAEPTSAEELREWINVPKNVLKIKGMLGNDNNPVLPSLPKKEKSMYNNDKYNCLLFAPFNVSPKCCDIMKKKPLHKYEKESKRYPYNATMASESRLRESAWLKSGCNVFNGTTKISKPMSFWTEQDVLQYIQKYNVPYASIYGDIVKQEDTSLKTTGVDRTGCIFCMFGCHLEKEPNRFQRLEKTHPRQYTWCIGGGTKIDGKWVPDKNGLGLGKILDFIGVNYKND